MGKRPKTKGSARPPRRLGDKAGPPHERSAQGDLIGANPLSEFRHRSARTAYEAEKFEEALEWLSGMPDSDRPVDLESSIYFELAKDALSRGSWGLAQDRLASGCAVLPDPLHQKRLGLLRRREPLVADEHWD